METIAILIWLWFVIGMASSYFLVKDAEFVDGEDIIKIVIISTFGVISLIAAMFATVSEKGFKLRVK